MNKAKRWKIRKYMSCGQEFESIIGPMTHGRVEVVEASALDVANAQIAKLREQRDELLYITTRTEMDGKEGLDAEVAALDKKES